MMVSQVLFPCIIMLPTLCFSLSVLTLQNEISHNDLLSDEHWGPWGPWQPCSRSCGGGVTFMLRHCLQIRPDGTSECVGSNKKYSSCYIQDCPEGSVDFRWEQCSSFNNQSYRGRTHKWKPYRGSSISNPCELHCQPQDASFFIKLADKVVDGTRCRPNSYDVCVGGACQEVGCDMMLGSGLKEDKCMECGGDGSSCYLVTGVFSPSHPPTGYIDILIIPPGATNIHVDENRGSRNYLAVRNSSDKYVLNGGWKIDHSQTFQVAGTAFTYHRRHDRKRAPESLKAAGPTTELVHVDLVVEERNKGIRYSFYLPLGTDDPNGGNTRWKASKWSECNRDCGGGTQTRRLTCIKEEKKVSAFHCKSLQRPLRRQRCNPNPCRARWHVGNWTECSESCNGGLRFRQVLCTETPLHSNKSLRLIRDSRCLEDEAPPRPPSKERCNEYPCSGWLIGNWSACSTTCGIGQRTREVTCHPQPTCTSSSVPETVMECNLGPCFGIQWVVTEWSQCTEKCGKGMQTRHVHCVSEDGSMFADSLCRNLPRPDFKRICRSTSECTNTIGWMTGPWSECSARCGDGMQTRTVVCAFPGELAYQVFPDDHCPTENKPSFAQNCSKPNCAAIWSTGSWSACSVTCGGGRRTRDVLCLSEITNRSLVDRKCNFTEKPKSDELCNNEACSLDREPLRRVVTKKRMEVIECALTDYGCCPDNHTAARGRNLEGCPGVQTSKSCSFSQFGCCRNSSLAASGPNHLGCPEHDSCYIPPDRGVLCDKWTSRWYFDSVTLKCSHFWYGGCQGNQNNYVSKNECMSKCDYRSVRQSNHQVQSATFISTTSPMTSKTPRSFSATEKITLVTLAQTRVASAPVQLPITKPSQDKDELVGSTRSILLPAIAETASLRLNYRSKVLTQRECALHPSKGPCLRRVHRWYYDALDHSCKTFIFGGCAGNRNNFVTMEECELTCKNNRDNTNAVVPTHEPTKCELEKVLAQFDGRRTPQCQLTTGEFRPLQCVSDITGLSSMCWCVDPVTGHEIDGSRRHGSIAPDCDSFSDNLSRSCSRSRFGCCPDGRSPAQGPLGRGCPDAVRIRPGKRLVTARVGGSARLPCPAVGHPKPDVRWFKDGRQVDLHLPGASVYQDEENFSLIFKNVHAKDVGNYMCQASNGLGRARKTIVLTLEEDLFFRTRPFNVTTYEGQSVKLKCRIGGDHSVSVRWIKNGRLLHRSDKVHIKPWGDLRILRTSVYDAGRYTCTVSSKRNHLSASAYLTVLTRTSTRQPSSTTTVPTISPTLTTPEQCLDYPIYANCELIVMADMCRHKQYGKFCCASCQRSHHQTVMTGRRRHKNPTTNLSK